MAQKIKFCAFILLVTFKVAAAASSLICDFGFGKSLEHGTWGTQKQARYQGRQKKYLLPVVCCVVTNFYQTGMSCQVGGGVDNVDLLQPPLKA